MLMIKLKIREPELLDTQQFLRAVEQSSGFHNPWLSPPCTEKTFEDYIVKFKQSDHQAYLLINDTAEIVGVFNISNIVKGCFQSAYLGYYCFKPFSKKGLMSQGLKIVLKEIFLNLKLHRIEANIQPNNLPSIHLAKANKFCLEGFSKNYLQVDGIWKDHERWALTYEDWSK
jgi:ribosomal-protein-alanine N-acetyltransferase